MHRDVHRCGFPRECCFIAPPFLLAASRTRAAQSSDKLRFGPCRVSVGSRETVDADQLVRTKEWTSLRSAWLRGAAGAEIARHSGR